MASQAADDMNVRRSVIGDDDPEASDA